MSCFAGLLTTATLLSGCSDANRDASVPAVAATAPGVANARARELGNVAVNVKSPPSVTATSYPAYSSYYTGTTPFHQTVLQLMTEGATVLSPAIAANFISQGLGNSQPYGTTSGVGPMYVVHTGDPAYTFTCPAYGGCPATGMIAHFPSGATPATGSDHHLVSFDPVYLKGEVDGWGGYGDGCTEADDVQPTSTCEHPCNLVPGNPGNANCSYGGFTSFSGSGLGNAGNAAGYAYGLMQISPQDLLQGHIDHALGIVASCLDAGGVYPAGRTTTDFACAKLGVAEPNAAYGYMLHLKSTAIVASYGYSQYCSVIVQALQDYGAYTTDNNGGWGLGLEFDFVNNPLYTQSNPWTAIYASMLAGGDGTNGGPGGTFQSKSCLQRIPASDFEMIEIPNTLGTDRRCRSYRSNESGEFVAPARG